MAWNRFTRLSTSKSTRKSSGKSVVRWVIPVTIVIRITAFIYLERVGMDDFLNGRWDDGSLFSSGSGGRCILVVDCSNKIGKLHRVGSYFVVHFSWSLVRVRTHVIEMFLADKRRNNDNHIVEEQITSARDYGLYSRNTRVISVQSHYWRSWRGETQPYPWGRKAATNKYTTQFSHSRAFQ